jgi:hypothetical protein
LIGHLVSEILLDLIEICFPNNNLSVFIVSLIIPVVFRGLDKLLVAPQIENFVMQI